MNKAQILAVLTALVLFSGLYFGFDTKPDKQKVIEHSRALEGESTSFGTLVEEGLSRLSALQAESVTSLEKKVQEATDDGQRTQALKNLSGLWYQIGNLPVAGGFAEQAAAIENADSSWSVAGGTFFTGLITAKDDKIRQYCASHAVKAFESAASLAPEKVEHRVNLALVWAENPPPDNPMKAVLMLRELESKHPDNASVYNALGRLAIKTGQWQRAVERLEKAWSLDKNNPNTPCLLAKAYEGAGDIAKSTEYAQRCNDGK